MDPFTTPPPELRYHIPEEKEINGVWRYLCWGCGVRPEECRVVMGGRGFVLCAKCGVHLALCRVHHVQVCVGVVVDRVVLIKWVASGVWE